jgi:hypothetical protein
MESDKMKYLELKNTVEKLLNFMERYNLDDYNERLVKRTLNELLYVIDIDEIDLKKEKEINDILYSLFPPRGGLTEMYVADDDREKMNKINDELGELKKKLANYELI